MIGISDVGRADVLPATLSGETDCGHFIQNDVIFGAERMYHMIIKTPNIPIHIIVPTKRKPEWLALNDGILSFSFDPGPRVRYGLNENLWEPATEGNRLPTIDTRWEIFGLHSWKWFLELHGLNRPMISLHDCGALLCYDIGWCTQTAADDILAKVHAVWCMAVIYRWDKEHFIWTEKNEKTIEHGRFIASKLDDWQDEPVEETVNQTNFTQARVKVVMYVTILPGCSVLWVAFSWRRWSKQYYGMSSHTPGDVLLE